MARRKTGPRAWVRVSHRTKDLPKSKRRWEVVYEDPNQRFKRRTKGGFTTKGEAEDWRDSDECPTSARPGEWVDPARGDACFRDVGKAWLKTYVSPSGKVRGYTQHAQVVNGKRSLVMTEFGDARIGDITHSMIGGWINKMQAKGRSASTMRHNFYTFRKIMRFAVAEGLISRDPTGDLKPPQPRDMDAEEADRDPLTTQEVQALIAALSEPWDMYVRLLAATGMRPEELTAVQLRDLNAECTAIQVRRVLVKHGGKLVIEEMLKTRRSRRVVDLDDTTSAHLRRYLEKHKRRAEKWFAGHPEHVHPADRLPLFVGVGEFQRGKRQRKTGTDLDWLDFTRPAAHGWFAMRHWDAGCKKAGIPEDAGVQPYDLRHFHASWHVARLGQPGALTVTEISERLGHASTAMTLNRYAHSPRDRQEQRRAALDMWVLPDNVTALRKKA